MDAVVIGKRLIELRGDRSQEKVARDNDLSLSAYTKYERGERIPRDEIKIRLAAYYQKTVQEIFFAENCHKT
jgi:transcriptional regulator with XRE-family HTH domain